SEKIASEIAALLKIRAAKVELAEFQGRRGSACRSFVFRTRGQGLIHGSEILAGRVFGYDKTRMRGQNQHSISNIITAVEQSFARNRRRRQLTILSGYIFLDALICNTDRHHDNWGFLRWRPSRGKPLHSVAPSFDHASSLGRELSDERRKGLMEGGKMLRYIQKGHGGVFWDEGSSKGANPMELAVRAARRSPYYFRPWFEQLRQLDSTAFHDIVDRVPDERMGQIAKSFSKEFLRLTRQLLEEVRV
ncbi:MAG: hypothetical protein ACRD2L_10395, partial [Terriglobia bacterium]